MDNFGEEPRFEVVYELYSMAMGVHLRLKLLVSEDDPTVRYRLGYLADRRLARARGLRHDGHAV